ncbi:MAG: TldD/PmbA family protein [Defluviitaleaceae bacterium]|nr:TldD/PmbA family protein [Defluviitaleaceae bacterium]
MDLKNFKDKLFAAAKAAGLKEYELYCKRASSFDVSIFEAEIDAFKSERTFGVSFRGKVGGKMGYAFSEKIDDAVVAFLIESVKQNASIIEDEEEEFVYSGDASYPEVVCYNPAINDITADTKIEAAMSMERAALAVDKRVENLTYCAVDSTESEVYIANSKGLEVQNIKNRTCAVADAQVEGEDGQVKTAYDGFDGLDFSKFDPVVVGQKAANKALAMLGASPVPSGKYPVVFVPETAGDMLETWIAAFSAEKAQKGFSILAGKIGEKIAADCVTIIDDPLLPGLEATTPFDSEGVAARTKTVVDNGVFMTFLHNTKTARKDGVAPTGNGFKSSLEMPVDIAATNFYVKPGTLSHEALLEKMGNGLVIAGVEGLHSGANETSGDFSLAASGFLVEGGKVVRAVDQITISGNFFAMMKDVVAVGSNLEFKLGDSTNNTAVPSLYVSCLDVAGS